MRAPCNQAATVIRAFINITGMSAVLHLHAIVNGYQRRLFAVKKIKQLIFQFIEKSLHSQWLVQQKV